MAQQLIVEGNDAYSLAEICRKQGLPSPLGYESKGKFEDFVKKGNGFEGALKLLIEALDKSDIDNIGIIVDANDVGAAARWQSIKNVLSQKFQAETLETALSKSGYRIIQEEGMPVIGVWIMPDNNTDGYLEHFLSKLIPLDDQLWSYAQQTIAEIKKQPYNKITSAKEQKALLHTWLAWQKTPGLPFGQAIKANYFDTSTKEVQLFLDWFKATFQLSAT
ncbi:MAG: hypothetical protein JNM22_23560 [Saprospiraceae bacterium]|nr:hypothetical protein [Saprospiraceae bacterium]